MSEPDLDDDDIDAALDNPSPLVKPPLGDGGNFELWGEPEQIVRKARENLSTPPKVG